jgi:lysophospholipase L1-like esterase
MKKFSISQINLKRFSITQIDWKLIELERNIDEVVVNSREAVTTTGIQLDTTSTGLNTFFPLRAERIRQHGLITRVDLPRVNSITNLEEAKIYFWSGDGGIINPYLKRGMIDLMPLQTGDHSLTLVTPLAVKEGDFYSLFTKKTGIGSVGVFYCAFNGGITQLIYHYAGTPPDSYTWNDFAAHTPFPSIFHFAMQAPLIVAIGDSITQSTAVNYSLIWAGDTLAFDFDKSWEGKLYNLDNRCVYQNMGHGGDTTTQMLARFDTDVILLKPRICLIQGGVNDIFGGVITKMTYLSNIKDMLDKCVTNGIYAVISEIMPWTNGSNAQMQIRDLWTADLRTLVAAYTKKKAFLINWDTILGKNRVGGDIGNLWDIKTVYDGDGVHFNEAGYSAIADEIYKVIQTGKQ